MLSHVKQYLLAILPGLVWLLFGTLFFLVWGMSHLWLFIAVLLSLSLLAFVSLKFPKVRFLAHVVPVIGDVMRVGTVRSRVLGNEWLEDNQLSSSGWERAYMKMPPAPKNPELVLYGLHQVTIDKLRAKAESRVEEYGAHDMKLDNFRGRTRKVVITWRRTNPLDTPFISETFPILSPERMAIECMKKEDGSLHPLEFFETSSMLVSGLPGSGKTYSLTIPLLVLDKSPYCDLLVIDGKNGSDWDEFSNKIGISGTRDKAESMIHEVLEEVRYRYSTGVTKFWNTPLNDRPTFTLLVIDECQQLFVTSTDKQEKEQTARIVSMLKEIVTTGRAAGVCVLFMSQRLTVDSLPSELKATSSSSFVFKVRDDISAEAGLGQKPLPGDSWPTRIGKDQRGRCVSSIDDRLVFLQWLSIAPKKTDAVAG